MATTQPLYRDAALPIERRVADLLARMTVAEKVAQLGSVWSFELLGGTDVRSRRGRARSWATGSVRSPVSRERRT